LPFSIDDEAEMPEAGCKASESKILVHRRALSFELNARQISLDDTYQIYINRVARLTLPEVFQSQVQHIQPSPKFVRQADGRIQPASFPGYTIVSPPWEDDPHNYSFYEALSAYQRQTVATLEPGLLIPVPPESFHFTLADLIWASAFVHATEDPAFEQQLHDRVAQSFEKCRFLIQAQQPLRWQIMGLFLRTRALGVCLAPRDEDSYKRVIELRRTIYQNPNLIALGIEQQYNFTAHITLGYFGEVAATTDRDRLAQQLIALNQHWYDIDAPQEIGVRRADLRKFDDMTRYYRQPDWTTLEF
jgi:2'-5' RNA ligase